MYDRPAETVDEGAASQRGFTHREGRTLLLLPERPAAGVQGPGTKSSGSVFYNPAMSGSRTRSVLLLRYAIEAGILGGGDIYALDGLTASGLRARRWLNELPLEMAQRIKATAVDLNEEALEWAVSSHEEFPPEHGGGDLVAVRGDLRVEALASGRHWVDIDPYGSPMPFIDSAMQSLARSSVLEVSATDTAALTGSSKNPLLRRYGARVRTDSLAHDSGLRVLLAALARSAARHDRAVQPLISIWDSHHLRVSVRVVKSVQSANCLDDSLGWRVSSPSREEVLDSIAAGLHHADDVEMLPMHCFLPFDSPVERGDPRISGPMWVLAIGDSGAMCSMTEERAVGVCGPQEVESDAHGWEERDFEMERRRIARSVRNIAEEGTVVDSFHHIVVDDLASWLGTGAPPSPSKMVGLLRDAGHRAGQCHYGRPSFRTDSPWEAVVEAAHSLQPPM